MKSAKIWIVAALTGLLCLLMAVPVNAEEQQITVQYSMGNSYTVYIPSSINLRNSSTVAIKAKYDIEPGKTLKVKVSDGVSDGKVTLKRKGDSETLTAKVKKDGNNVNHGTTVASFAGYSATEREGGTMEFTAPSGAKAGTYTGNITFSISVE